jgi:hypothetical protein
MKIYKINLYNLFKCATENPDYLESFYVLNKLYPNRKWELLAFRPGFSGVLHSETDVDTIDIYRDFLEHRWIIRHEINNSTKKLIVIDNLDDIRYYL